MLPIGKQELSWVEKGLLGEGEKGKRDRKTGSHRGVKKGHNKEQNEERYKMLVEPGKEELYSGSARKRERYDMAVRHSK